MLDTKPTLPPIGERLTLATAALVQPGDYVSARHKGRDYFGAVNTVVIKPGVFEGSHIGAGGMAGPIETFTFLGRPGRDRWMKFSGEHNPVGEALVEVLLATGAVMRKPGGAFPDVAWKAVITHIRPYCPPPIPSVEVVEQAMAVLERFGAVADLYDDREDDSFEIWLDRGVPGGPPKDAFLLGGYREARRALQALKGVKPAQA